MLPCVCLENVCGTPNFFPFHLMYTNDFLMILRYLDTLCAVYIEIHNDKIVILTDSFCTANPYVLSLESQKACHNFAKS